MTMALHVRHVGLTVKNLQRALWFYQDLLGLRVQTRLVEKGPVLEKVLDLEGVEVETVKLGTGEGNTLVELLSFRSHPVSDYEGTRLLKSGPTHLAFTVDDLAGLYEKMKAQGVFFNTAPQPSADGKVLLTYCQDPDGAWVELVQPL
ncbi:MAG: VOC family protein [Deltaproteobacteria bacterium]|nr:VOC family protein [Deltaproteobacteria bacterium]